MRSALVLVIPFLLFPAPTMGADRSTPTPVSPGAESLFLEISDLCPTFSWAPIAEADGYQIAVTAYPAGTRTPASTAIEVTIEARASSWSPSRSRCLQPGTRYSWAVRAAINGVPTAWSAARLFETPVTPSLDEFRRAVEVVETYLAAHSDEATAEDAAPVRPSAGTAALEIPGPLPAPGFPAIRLAASLQAPARTAGPSAVSLTVDGPINFLGASTLLHQGQRALGLTAESVAVGVGAQESALLPGNTAVGIAALAHARLPGIFNSAVGAGSLTADSTGGANSALGAYTLAENVTGFGNVAMGYAALTKSKVSWNTAVGTYSMFYNYSGCCNTGIGRSALLANSSGAYNTAVGFQALPAASGNRNVGLGYRAGWSNVGGDDNVFVSNEGAAAESGSIRIGTEGVHVRAFLAGVAATPLPGGSSEVFVSDQGQLGIAPSSIRFKRDVHALGAEYATRLLDLQPVRFRYREDPRNRMQFGLLAEDVERGFPELLLRDSQGRPLSIRREALPALLLLTIQSLRDRIEILESRHGWPPDPRAPDPECPPSRL